MSNVVICRFQVKPDSEAEFTALMKEHWPTLHRLGLVTDFAPLQLRRQEADGPVVVEVLEWKDREAARLAHEHPEVAAIWERMDTLLEERGSKPKWEFPDYERLA